MLLNAALRAVAAMQLVDGDGDGGNGLAEGVVGVEGVSSVGGGMNSDRSSANGADFGRNDDVRGAGDLPGESDAGAGMTEVALG